MYEKPVKEMVPYLELAREAGKAYRDTGKPVVAVLPNPKRSPDHADVMEMMAVARQKFFRAGHPCF